MPIQLSRELIAAMQSRGVVTALKPGAFLPDDFVGEAPSSLKRTFVEYSLELGAFSYVAGGFLGACRIGRYCSFGEDVQIGRQAHITDWISSSPVFNQPNWALIFDTPPPPGLEIVPKRDFRAASRPPRLKVTAIGHDVWVGHGAFVLAGVTIGTGAVIAARSVVTRDVPPYAVVAGTPAQVKRLRFTPEQVDALLASRWWEFAPWQLRGMQIDEPLRFCEQIAALRAGGEAAYAPPPLHLAELAADAEPLARHAGRRWWPLRKPASKDRAP